MPAVPEATSGVVPARAFDAETLDFRADLPESAQAAWAILGRAEAGYPLTVHHRLDLARDLCEAP